MKKIPAVTVIVALYNAEKFIGECLTSLANQTLQDFEIIVADDCSTDNSRAVVESFSATFGDRLKLLQLPENSGCPGIPRNFALQAARGKYIYFLDGDDLISETALEELCTVAEKFSADVVHCERCLSFSVDDGKITAEPHSFQSGKFVTEPTLETYDVAERIDGFMNLRFVWWACTKLFRREFLAANKITFHATPTYEDFIFELKCLVAAQNYVRVPFMNYYYRTRTDSLSRKTYDAITFARNTLKVFRELNEFMDGEKFFRENSDYKYPLLNFFMQGQLDLISRGLFGNRELDPAAVFNFFREKIFSVNPEDNIALTSYLFVLVNVLKVHANRQAAEIDALKKSPQLSKEASRG